MGPAKTKHAVNAFAAACLAGAVGMLAATGSSQAQSPARGTVLADLTWIEAEKRLTPDAVIVIPLGAEAKQHGPHLRLDNDAQLAAYFRGRVLAAADVVVAPTFTYHFYPAFVEYPGSTHLRFETARDLVVDAVRSLAAFGPRKFYVLNTGVSTARPLAAAKAILEAEGIEFAFSDISVIGASAEKSVRQQARGTHADEIETSMMLFIRPDRVDMAKAVKDDSEGSGPLTRREGNTAGTYSASGIWGDATLATREKGRVVVEAMVTDILAEIEALRRRPPR